MAQHSIMKVNVKMLVAQSCLTLCDPMDCSPQDPLSMSCHFLLQGIFLAQGSNLGLLHCRLILYHLSHQGSQTNHRLNVFSQMSISTSPFLRQVNIKCLPISQKTPSYCFIGPLFLFLRDLILAFNTTETRDQFYLFQKFCNEN